jgi:phospholipase/carboxylesterase
VAYTTALTHPEKLAGLIALSTYIPVQRLLVDEKTEANKAIPVFAAHGMDDDVVAPELGMAARDFLLVQGYSVEWHEYPMPHSVCLPEVKAIGKWLKARMAAG